MDAEQDEKSALMLAAWFRHEAIVTLLLESGANVNAATSHGQTALILAGNANIVEKLLSYEADANKQTNDGWTALMRAARRNNKDIVILLLDNGADTTLTNNKGKTAEQLACLYEVANLIKEAPKIFGPPIGDNI